MFMGIYFLTRVVFQYEGGEVSMHEFGYALLGGMTLGLAATGYLYIVGRIAGISGFIGQLFDLDRILTKPAFYFLLGILTCSFVYGLFFQPDIQIEQPTPVLIIAGLLVGFGTRLGSGCTSGHGICGISRLSRRSIVATSCFMVTGMVTVYILRHVIQA